MRRISKFHFCVLLCLLQLLAFGYFFVNTKVKPARSIRVNDGQPRHKNVATAPEQRIEIEQLQSEKGAVVPENQEVFLKPRNLVEITAAKPSSYKVDIVIGIPSIKRPGGKVYLDQTMKHLVVNRAKFDRVVFLVYLAENDTNWISDMTNMMKSMFAELVDSGMIRIILPPDDLYPDWDKDMKLTLGDPPHQVKWRSKQNLDQAFLMEYAHSLNTKYYLGIEDDVTAAQDYLRTIFQHAETSWNDDIIFASYCKYGAIGKLFSSKSLPMVSSYLKTFWNYKPLDWLYWDLKRIVSCRYPLTDCDKLTAKATLEFGKDLFIHDGKISSLVKTKP